MIGVRGGKWSDDMERLIRAECPIKSKADLLTLLNNVFGTTFTMAAMTTFCCTKRIQLGVKPWQNNSGKFRGREPRSIFAEREKKGYVQIKVAQPNVWMQKNQYVWNCAHPDDKVKVNEAVIFLDGDNHNFAIENLYKIDRKIMSLLNKLRKPEDTAEIVLTKIYIAQLKILRYEKAKECGYTKGAACTDVYYAWRDKHREHLRVRQREYQRRYYARKKKGKGLQ